MALTSADAHSSLVLRAAVFAAYKHREQRRHDGCTPYINHPLSVADVLSRVGNVRDADVLAAALLHDTIEDTETTADELRTTFGERILSLVLECTDDKSLPKSERKRLQVVNAPHKSPEAKTIKIADKISNMSDLVTAPPVDWSTERKREYVQWCDEVFQGLKGTNLALDNLFEQTRNHAHKQVHRTP